MVYRFVLVVMGPDHLEIGMPHIAGKPRNALPLTPQERTIEPCQRREPRIRTSPTRVKVVEGDGAPGGIRTHDPQIHTTTVFTAILADVRGLDFLFTVGGCP